MGCLHDEADMKQIIRAHVVHVYFQYICFMFASSCKHPIMLMINTRLADGDCSIDASLLVYADISCCVVTLLTSRCLTSCRISCTKTAKTSTFNLSLWTGYYVHKTTRYILIRKTYW